MSIGSLTRKNDKYNILCGSTHERYQGNLSRIGHNFWAFKFNQHFKKWDQRYNKMPNNYVEFQHSKVPMWLDFDIVLTQHKFGQFQELLPISRKLSLPLISIEHTCSMPFWSEDMKNNLRNMRGDINIFITEWSLDSWGWSNRNDTYIIEHAINTDIFYPANKQRQPHILTVVNDYVGRGQILGINVYMEATQNLNVRRIGDSPGFSYPAKDIHDLANEYQTSQIFVNTSLLSPIPMSLLEAMACGCCVVSLNTCAIPDYIKDGYNGFLVKNSKEMRDRIQLLLIDKELRNTISKNAVSTIQSKCSIERFIKEWHNILKKLNI